MLYHSKLRRISTGRLLELERKFYEQKQRYRDSKTRNGRHWYTHWSKQHRMVTEELHKRPA